ncbi:unnamed protein product [Caenorhabditis angaria]|uniref:Uncharacterized protein n=1 Tax=Caenorhabditis angaria TaxID=860376 RepID=A0A9P1I871_9PELO|nr:unnamed protein product [Caenorhabditis angaria]
MDAAQEEAEIAKLKIEIAKLKKELAALRFAEMARSFQTSEVQDPILENQRIREEEEARLAEVERAKNQWRCDIM